MLNLPSTTAHKTFLNPHDSLAFARFFLLLKTPLLRLPVIITKPNTCGGGFTKATESLTRAIFAIFNHFRF